MPPAPAAPPFMARIGAIVMRRHRHAAPSLLLDISANGGS
jgi:hypothetical protein